MNTATQTSLYINQNGMISCIGCGGSYLQSAYGHAPERPSYLTPLDSWERIDPKFVQMWVDEMGAAPVCEFCR